MRVRAHFIDLDGNSVQPALAWHFRPSLIVESSPGRCHVYWAVGPDLAADLQGFSERQRKLALTLGGDPVVIDLPRVLRLAGFVHRKAAPFQSRVVPREQWDALP